MRKATSPANLSTADSSRVGLLCFLWVAFVIYGSLVPFDFNPLPWDIAWRRLSTAPMLELGIESRADWVANGVLYLPVGFLTTGMLMRAAGRGVSQWLIPGCVGLLFGAILAVAVEFAQTAFPPRTVSRNDMIAEIIGTAIGVLIALAGARKFQAMIVSFGHGNAALSRQLGIFYALLFPAIVLFPFDLLLDINEWHRKLASAQVGLWLAGSGVKMGLITLVAKLLIETLAVAPLGAIWAARRRRISPGQTSSAAQQLLIGALLGMLVELAQLAFASGQSQGASVLTRAAGFAFGGWVYQHGQTIRLESVRAAVRQITLPITLVLLPLLLLVNGAWRGPWLAPEQAIRRLLNDIEFLPFYYHYYTTEAQAVVSLVAVSLSYAPIGILGWAWLARPGVVAILATILAAAIELSKLFSLNTHPDPTNLWIAAASSWLTQTLLKKVFSQSLPRSFGKTVGH